MNKAASLFIERTTGFEPDESQAVTQELDISPRKLNRRALKQQQIRRSLHTHAILNLTVPTVGVIAALVLASRIGIRPWEIAILLVTHFLTAGAISVSYHRHLAHKSYRAVGPVRALLMILACMAAQGPPIYWTAVHRQHHAFSDEAGDPHSPNTYGPGLLNKMKGLLHAHMGWLLDHPNINYSYYARDLQRDPLVRRIDRLYYHWILLGLLIPAASGWMITGTALGALQGFLWGGLVRLFVALHVTWSINSICHVFGNRPYATTDGSVNNWWLSIPTAGESWHNNHHAFPYSAMLGLRPTEVDLGGWAIRILEACRLVSDVKVPSQAAIENKRVA